MESTIRYLHYILLGMLIVLIDIPFLIREAQPGRLGIQVDIANDIIGASLLIVGIYKLRKHRINIKYRRWINIALFGAIFQFFWALSDLFIYVPDLFMQIFQETTGIFIAWTTVAFCKAMILLSNRSKFYHSSVRWRMAQLLCGVFYVAPLTFFHTKQLLEFLHLAPSGLLDYHFFKWLEWGAFIGFFIPLTYIYWLLPQMKKEYNALRIIG